MGKRKRPRDYDHLMKKLKRLEEKIRHRGRPRTPESSSDTDKSVQGHHKDTDDHVESQPVESPIHADDIQQACENIDPELAIEAPRELDPKILKILGDDPTSLSHHGENLHSDVMPRWKHILTNGLDKDIKADLLKQYLPPENCGNLRAPKLNLEIKAALNEVNAKKEVFNELKQNQLSSGLAALGKALNIVLNSNESEISEDIIKPLSDAGRILCDYHYRESQSRRYSIINILNKDIRETVKATKMDEYLFGADLSDQIKTAKAISKSGSELKTPRPQSRTTSVPGQVHPRGALNLRGARGTASASRQFPSRRPPLSTSTPAVRGRDHMRRNQRGRGMRH